MGHSGGPHALACGALLPEHVVGVVSIAGLAPFGAEGQGYSAGMANPAPLQAAAAGRAAKERYEADPEYDPEVFIRADQAALSGRWSVRQRGQPGDGRRAGRAHRRRPRLRRPVGV